jgi:hypothetical protein
MVRQVCVVPQYAPEYNLVAVAEHHPGLYARISADARTSSTGGHETRKMIEERRRKATVLRHEQEQAQARRYARGDDAETRVGVAGVASLRPNPA